MWKILAVVVGLFFVSTPAFAQAPPPGWCPPDAEYCRATGYVREQESVRQWGGHPQMGGPNYNGGRGGVSVYGTPTFNANICLFGCNNQRSAAGGYGQMQRGGPVVAAQCAPGEFRSGNTCSACRPGLVFAQHPQTGQLICVAPQQRR